MQTVEGNRLDGCEFSPEAGNEYRMEFGNASLPTQVDLRPHCTPVENQGQIGSCTANAAIGALEYAYKKRDGQAPELSRMFVYFNTRRLKGTIPFDTGAQINEAMAAVLAFGACEASYWPYDPRAFLMQPPQMAYANAKLHEAIQYARVPGPEGAKHALAGGYPVVFGAWFPSRLYDEAAKTGVMPASTPDERGGRPSGGHCMLIVGYDDARKAFIVRNSWGAQWGNGGYCDIPYSEMAVFGAPESFWIMTELEPKAAFSIIKPEASAGSGEAPSLNVTAAGLREEIAGDLRKEIGDASKRMKSRAESLRASITGSGGSQQGFGYDDGGKLDLDPPPTPPARCSVCQGQGSCWYCKGTGTNMGYPCGKCSNGQCYVCSGSGFS